MSLTKLIGVIAFSALMVFSAPAAFAADGTAPAGKKHHHKAAVHHSKKHSKKGKKAAAEAAPVAAPAETAPAPAMGQ